MGYRRYVYPPAIGLLLYVLVLLVLIIVLPLLFLGVTQVVFRRLGFTPLAAFTILVLSLLGSAVNIPVYKMVSKQPILAIRYYTFYGITYPVPTVVPSPQKTIVALNLGGAIIPTAISTYLWVKEYPHTPQILVCLLIVTLVCYRLAKPIEGVGIVMPAFVPPIVAATSAFIVSLGDSPLLFASAYIAGSLGTLIGADLLNLKKLSTLRAQIVSIGGAGTFDGIFVSGILAVVIAVLFSL